MHNKLQHNRQPAFQMHAQCWIAIVGLVPERSTCCWQTRELHNSVAQSMHAFRVDLLAANTDIEAHIACRQGEDLLQLWQPRCPVEGHTQYAVWSRQSQQSCLTASVTQADKTFSYWRQRRRMGLSQLCSLLTTSAFGHRNRWDELGSPAVQCPNTTVMLESVGAQQFSRIPSMCTPVPAADAKKAEGANDGVLIPRQPFLTCSSWSSVDALVL